MRPPRYHFPEEVRTATRTIAARMTREGSVASTPEELDTWISLNDDVKAPLVSGGYGTRFNSEDLLPLLHAMTQTAAPAAPAAPPRGRSNGRWLAVGAAVALLIALAVIALNT